MSMPVTSSTTAIPKDLGSRPMPTLLFSSSSDSVSSSALSQKTMPETAVSTERAKTYFQNLSEQEQQKIQIKKGKDYWKQIGCCKKIAQLFCHCRWSYASIGKFYMETCPYIFQTIWQKRHGIKKLNGIKTPPSSPAALGPHLSIDLQQIKKEKQKVEQKVDKANVVVPLGGAPEEASCDIASTTTSAFEPRSMAALEPTKACSSVETTSCSPSQGKN